MERGILEFTEHKAGCKDCQDECKPCRIGHDILLKLHGWKPKEKKEEKVR